MTDNQQIYTEFQQDIGKMNQQRADLERDMIVVKQQLENMELEIANLDKSITLWNGGMSTVEMLTKNGYAIVKHDGLTPLTINPYQATQQMAQQAGIAPTPAVQTQAVPQAQSTAPPASTAPQPQVAPSQTQYAQQPTQGAYTPQPAITQQAQDQFAPPPPPMTPMIPNQTTQPKPIGSAPEQAASGPGPQPTE